MPKHIIMPENARRVCLILFLLFSGIYTSLFADTLIAPDNPKINYFGRFDITDPAKPSFNWSGTTIEFRSPGPTVGMRMSHPNGWYDIEIDGVIDTVIKCGSSQQYIFNSNLSSSMHTVRIILRSEDHNTKAIFQGILLANGKTLGDAPSKPARKIEFIGDSYSAGYGVESSGRTCDTEALHKYTNANKAFPMLITKALHAQSIILGYSGKGVSRNFNDNLKRSVNPFYSYYNRIFGDDETKKWDFSQWNADLVVICLGTNDFSTTPHPDDSMFTEDYHKLINQVIINYPSAKIACVPTTNDIIKRLVKDVVSKENNNLNHPQVFAAAFPASIENSACDWHPSIKDHQAIAKILVDTIMKKLDWDTSATSVSFQTPLKYSQQSEIILLKAGINRIFFKIPSVSLFHNKVYLLGINGQKLAQTIPNHEGMGVFHISSFSNTMYILGNKNIGWKKVALTP